MSVPSYQCPESEVRIILPPLLSELRILKDTRKVNLFQCAFEREVPVGAAARYQELRVQHTGDSAAGMITASEI
jgi:hypothetical protein